MGMSGLYVGLSGLQTASNSLNTTANNLANVNTTGYVRQQVVNADKNYHSVMTTSNTSTGQMGLGVTIGTINHVRDIFLDMAYRKELGRQDFYDKMYNAVYEIETQMGETDFISGIGFQDTFASMLAAMNEVAKAPTDQTSRAALVQSSVQFVNEAQNIYNGIANYQSNLNQEIIDTTNRINEIGERMVYLNQRISKVEAGGVEQAMDDRDERDLLLDELGKYVKIAYSEDDHGVCEVSIEGVHFADELSYTPIGLKNIQATDFVIPVWSTMNDQPLYNLNHTISTENNTDIGGMKGLIVARGTLTPTVYNMTAPDPYDYSDSGDVNNPDYIVALGAHEEYKVSSKISTIVNTLANFDKLVSSIMTGVNDILCPNTTITTSDGRTLTVLDESIAPMSADGTMGIELFKRNYCERYTKQNIDGTDYYVMNKKDSFGNLSVYSIPNVAVNTSILQDYSLIPLQNQDGAAAYDKAEQMVKLFSEDMLTYNGGADKLTFEEFYETLIHDVANTGSIYHSMSENESTLSGQLDSQRQQILGVSSDDELSHMIRYQQAYNAASRFINVESEMIDSLLRNLGAG